MCGAGMSPAWAMASATPSMYDEDCILVPAALATCACTPGVAQVTAIFGSSLEVMISVFGETPSAGKVRSQ